MSPWLLCSLYGAHVISILLRDTLGGFYYFFVKSVYSNKKTIQKYVHSLPRWHMTYNEHAYSFVEPHNLLIHPMLGLDQIQLEIKR